MASVSIPLVAAGVGAAGSVASAAIGSSAAHDAAQQQREAAQQASAQQMAMFREVQGNLSPWVSQGKSASDVLARLTGTNAGGDPTTALLTKEFRPDMATLEQTPGYQFTRDQGLRATQNSFAAQGLGASGSALRGAADYASGLASQTWGQQFAQHLAQNQQIYGMLFPQSQLGESAAAMTGQLGNSAQTTANQFLSSGAAAGAAGTIGSANAMMGGISGAGNSLSSLAMFQALQGGGMFGNGGTTGTTMNLGDLQG